MDATMKLVMKHCSSEMSKYAECVEKHPHSWPSTCDMLRLSVARCSDTHPVIKKIKLDCANVFDKYNQCIRVNPTSVERCMSLYQTFNDCVEEHSPKPDVL